MATRKQRNAGQFVHLALSTIPNCVLGAVRDDTLGTAPLRFLHQV